MINFQTNRKHLFIPYKQKKTLLHTPQLESIKTQFTVQHFFKKNAFKIFQEYNYNFAKQIYNNNEKQISTKNTN